MYNRIKKLIERLYYSNAAEARDRLDVFVLVEPPRLTAEEYAELYLLVESVYNAPMEEEV